MQYTCPTEQLRIAILIYTVDKFRYINASHKCIIVSLCTRSAQPLSAPMERSLHRNWNEWLKCIIIWNLWIVPNIVLHRVFSVSFRIVAGNAYYCFPATRLWLRINRWNRWNKSSGSDIRIEHGKWLKRKTHYRGHARHIWGIIWSLSYC